MNNNLSILGFSVSVLKDISYTLLYSGNGNSLVVFERAKNLCLSINQLSMKRPWPGGFFLTFSHNTILLTPWMQMKTPKSNSLTRKDWFIHYCFLWPVITASPQYFAPEAKIIPFTGSEVPEVYSSSSWLFCFPLEMLLLLHFLKT